MKFSKLLTEVNTPTKILTLVIKKLTKKYEKEYGIPACEINSGECMNFAEEVYSILTDKYNISVEILSDAFFYDPFDEYEEQNKYATPEEYNLKALWDYKEIGMPSHYWIYFNNKHYDSDSPNGVSNFFNLKTFQKYYKQYLKTKNNPNKRH